MQTMHRAFLKKDGMKFVGDKNRESSYLRSRFRYSVLNKENSTWPRYASASGTVSTIRSRVSVNQTFMMGLK